MSSSSKFRQPARRARLRGGLSLFLSLLLVAVVALPRARVAAAVQEDAADMPVNKKTDVKHPLGEYVPGEVLVRFRDEATAKASATGATLALRVDNGDGLDVQLESFEGSELVEGLRLARVRPEATIEAVEALNARADVLYAEPNYIRRKDQLPNDPAFSNMWALKNTGQSGPSASAEPANGTPGADIDAESAWDLTTGSSSVVVGVIDEGIDINHPDLRDNIWVNPGESANDGVDNDGNGYRDDINGWDFFHEDKTVYDGAATDNSATTFNETRIDSHGTHVAGTIGARGNNGVGATGINWQVKLMSLKILGNPDNPGDAPAPTSVRITIKAYRYAKMMRDRGINLRVLNNSYGGGGFSQSEVEAIKALSQSGILFVAAAGNDASDNFIIPHYPSDYDLPNVINVAATNRIDGISAFSSFGARVVSMGAPGSAILSTVPNGGYAYSWGTSMASPHVAGAAALVLAANPGLTVQQLRGVLAYSGDVIPSMLATTTTGRRLNVFNSINSARETGGGVDSIAPAAASNLQFASQSGRDLTLIWNAPGDDDNSGTAADYDFFFINSSTGLRTLLPTTLQPAPAGTQQSTSVALPYRNFNGTIELRTIDNAGNISTVSIPVSAADNAGSDPYIMSTGGGGGLSTGGNRLNLDADDRYQNHPLPFDLKFFGTNHGKQITLSSNGAIYVPPYASPALPPRRDNNDAGDLPSSIAGLNRMPMIAGLWDDIDLRTCFRADAGIYVVEPDANTVIFRWQGVPFQSESCPASPSSSQINFEIELKSDGTITMRYGDGNNNLHPVVGVSPGEADAYVASLHTSPLPGESISLSNAASVVFMPRTDAPCIYNVGFSDTSFPGTGGSGTINITTASGCHWDATTINPWIILSTPTGGNGNGTVNFTVKPNSGNPTPRFGSISVAGTSYSITQGISIAPASMQFSSAAYAVNETAGTAQITVTRTDNIDVSSSIDYLVIAGSATAGDDFIATGGTFIFNPGDSSKTFDITILNDSLVEQPETINLTLQNPNGLGTFGSPSTAVLTITSDDVAVPNDVQFQTLTGSVPEDDGRIRLNVTRTGNTTQPATVFYQTSNGTASDRSDYSIAIGTLRFAAGETLKSIDVFITDDAFDEADETLSLTLGDTSGTTLGSASTATLTITDNDASNDAANPVNDSTFFVRQHYVDFFNREPDAGGLGFWTNQIDSCGDNVECREVRRINVSAAFFVSIEFQETGYLVYRAHHAAFGTGQMLGYRRFLADTQEIGRGVVINQGDWQAQLEANKQAFFKEFVTRPEFIARHPLTLSSQQYVDTLNYHTNGALTPAEANALVAGLNGSTETRATVLRKVAENRVLQQNEYSRAFVLMQYFGYLRRAPNDAPDTDFTGFDFWLVKLNRDGGNYITSEMVKGFITSPEYLRRFGN